MSIADQAFKEYVSLVKLAKNMNIPDQADKVVYRSNYSFWHDWTVLHYGYSLIYIYSLVIAV